MFQQVDRFLVWNSIESFASAIELVVTSRTKGLVSILVADCLAGNIRTEGEGPIVALWYVSRVGMPVPFP